MEQQKKDAYPPGYCGNSRKQNGSLMGMQPEDIQRSQPRDKHGNWADPPFCGLPEKEERKQQDVHD